MSRTNLASTKAAEKLNGNCKVSEVVERISTVERLLNQRIVARESRRK